MVTGRTNRASGTLWIAAGRDYSRRIGARPWEGLRDATNEIRKNLKSRKLKSPTTIQQWELLTKPLVRSAGDLYAVLGTQNAPLIEGPYRSMSLAWPR